MRSTPILSICIPTYNHERYIEQALDSVFMQETEYSYEVLVGEDCSTDNTRSILMKYEQGHHYTNLQVLYRSNNMSKQEITNTVDLRIRSQGKYIITLEGDDYWTDKYKLQKQIDFLENNNDYIAVSHNCVVVDSNSHQLNETYPECKDQEYTIKHFASGLMPGQLATMMYRNYYLDPAFDKRLVNLRINPGDKRIVFSLLNNGKIFCIQEIMSAYRHVLHGGSSFSATRVYDYYNELNLSRAYIDYASSQEMLIYSETMLALSIQAGLKNKVINFKQAISDGSVISHKARVIALLAKRNINKHIFHKNLLF